MNILYTVAAGATWLLNFMRNARAAVRRTSVALMMQLFKTAVSGSVNYLRLVITLGADVQLQLVRVVTRATRFIARERSHSSSALGCSRGCSRVTSRRVASARASVSGCTCSC